MSTITATSSSIPDSPEEMSRGSSVSSGFINQYEEILKFAVVAPKMQLGGDGFIDICRVEDTRKNVKQKESPADSSLDSSTSSSSSNSTSALSSIAQFETGRTINDGDMEIKVIEAKKAIDQRFKSKIGSSAKSSSTHAVNAMDTLLETPKELKRTMRKVQFDSSADSSPESLAGEISSPSIDQDLVRMDAAMEDWCLQLKRNVLNELADMKKKQFLYQEQAMDKMKSKHNGEIMRSTHEVESMKELLHSFEQSVKQKDEVITNLTSMLNKQKEKSDKIRLFSIWRLKHNDEQRQGFADKMAEKFYKRTLTTKVWIAWRSVVENTWKRRVEKACQIKSQEICLKLTEDYEERLQALQKELAAARAEIAKMHTERDGYEENMKKAFMRGVCALNMEAMSMFKDGQPQHEDEVSNGHDSQPLNNSRYPCTYGGNVVREAPNKESSAVDARIQQALSQNNQLHTTQTTQQASKKKVRFDTADARINRTPSTGKANVPNQRKNINVKMTGRKDYGTVNKTGGPQSTISSIMVERHMQQPLRSSSSSSQPSSRSTTPNFLATNKKPLTTSVVVD